MNDSNPYGVPESISTPVVERPSSGPRRPNVLSRLVIMLLLGMGVCFVFFGASFFVLYWIATLMSTGA